MSSAAGAGRFGRPQLASFPKFIISRLLNMLLHHLKMAWKVLRRRTFLTLLSLVGIGATLMSLLVAVGATGPGISRQFVAETLVLTSLAVAPGLLLAVQFPLLGVFGQPLAVYAVGMGLAAALVYGFAVVCAVQPSWQAARIRPAVALREE